MSEPTSQRRRRRRNRNRPPVIEEGGQEAPAASGDDSDGGAKAGGAKSKTDRRRGARVQAEPPKRATILGLPRMMFFIMAGLLVVIVSTTVAQQFVNVDDEIEGVLAFPDQGRRHLAEGETLSLDNYNSYPPTSGPQRPDAAQPGIYGPAEQDEDFQAAPPFEKLLPILERGGIVIYYDPERLAGADVGVLKQFVASVQGSGQDLVTLVELDDSLPSPIVATAWRHTFALATLDENAQERLIDFVSDHPLGLYGRFVLESNAATLRAAPPAAEDRDDGS